MSKDDESTVGAHSSLHLSLSKNVNIFATDMTEEARSTIIGVAQRAFHAPVNQGRVYQTIADLIRTATEKEVDDGTCLSMESHTNGSGGWSCVVGDHFGSSVTHRMKTYIHFSVVPGVNVLLWKS